MAVCPNCAKKLRDNFVYCRICGTKLSGENPGDFTTEMLNVFNHEDGFVYLFCENGNQVTLKAGSMEELALLAREKKYPWEFADKSKNSRRNVEMVGTPHFENDFLRASSLHKPEIIPTSSTFKKPESKEDDSSAVKKADSNHETKHSGQFAIHGRLKDDYMPISENRVYGRQFPLFGSRIKRNYMQKEPKSDEFWQNKFKMTKEHNQRRTDQISERLNTHNMDKLLR